MGTAEYGTEMNCYHKRRMGWITDEDTHVVKVEEAKQTILVNALGNKRAKSKCTIIQFEPATLDDTGIEYDSLILEYRATIQDKVADSDPDLLLKKLKEGSLTGGVEVNTEGILIRLAGTDTATTLINANAGTDSGAE